MVNQRGRIPTLRASDQPLANGIKPQHVGTELPPARRLVHAIGQIVDAAIRVIVGNHIRGLVSLAPARAAYIRLAAAGLVANCGAPQH